MLTDVLPTGLRLVVCGTAASARSAQIGAYYAGHGNKFWRTLCQTGLTPRQLAPSEFRLLPQFGIGLTDIVKDQAGNDAVIRFEASGRERLREVILAAAPTYLCFNGKRAAIEYFGTRQVAYGLQAGTIGTTKIFIAPSTSGAANGAWDLTVWEELGRLVTAIGH